MTTPNLRSLAASWRNEADERAKGAIALDGNNYLAGTAKAKCQCADELDAALDALEAQLDKPHSQDEIESCFASRNSGDIRKAESWSMEDWIRAHILGEKEKP